MTRMTLPLPIGAIIATNAIAGANGAFLAPVSAPTLSEVGLGLLVVALGLVGGLIARRKK
ncbi:MAG: IPTL-CTERM sorting domain-containing protein [Betaproteobacteria bacterium]|nr:IPTL-CTERM sorting domain-containing protein [Betaproteobacteria bacterium]